MLSQEEKEIYSRHLLLNEVGLEGQIKLKNSKVLVIGAGGLGCPVLQYINAAGVGTIGIVDFDNVDKSNLQRQILFDCNSIGKNKAEEAKHKLSLANTHNAINTYTEKLTIDNARELISQYDIIVDCTDNYETRYLVNDVSVLESKPLVYAAIFKFEGQVSVFNYKKGPTYRCLYPSPPKTASITNCSESGVIGVLAGIIGTMQANEVIKLILEIGTPLSGSINIYNSLTGQQNSFKISRKENRIYDTLFAQNALDKNLYTNSYCSTNDTIINEIEMDEFLLELKKGVQLIDVREFNEEPYLPELKAINIPLSQLDIYTEPIENRTTIVFCKSGIRSIKAIKTLRDKHNLDNLFNLKNGIQSYVELQTQ